MQRAGQEGEKAEREERRDGDTKGEEEDGDSVLPNVPRNEDSVKRKLGRRRACVSE